MYNFFLDHFVEFAKYPIRQVVVLPQLPFLVDVAQDALLLQAGQGVVQRQKVVADLQRRFASEEDGRGVQLLTYHRAKGKEFDAVFLPRLEDRELPFALAKTPEDRAEERRLLYVGITRSRRHLSLSWAASREDGPRRRLAPSPFLEEIRPPRATPPPASGPRTRTGAGEADGALLKALKEWRRDESRRRGVPAYVIFHDRTLTALAARRPLTLADLETVPGIGPAKLARYGSDLLQVLG